MSRRVKIKPVYPTNLFYEKVLSDWKANSSDTRGSSIIKKALNGLKVYPLALNDYTDLRKIKGIGEDIATRLDAAAQCFRDKEGDLTLMKVRALKRGDTLVYLREAVVLKGKKNVPFLTREVFKSPAFRLGNLSDDGAGPSGFQQANDEPRMDLNRSFSQPTFPTFEQLDDAQPGPSTAFSQDVAQRPKPARPVITIRKPTKVFSDALLEYDPELNASAELVLVVDGREDRSASGRAKSIGEHLTKRSVKYEMRPLTVGDYLWVLKLGSGAEKEMVLDYVVERKTWDDLKSSIRHSRYVEQKQRLCQSDIKNVIMVVEGSDRNVDRSLEQALVSTSLENGFLIQRTTNLANTARFLDDLTQHLKLRLKTEKITGHSFAWTQNESLKTKEISVSDCFLRQLTVCPQMSTNKAGDVVRLFPTMRALHNLYKNCDPCIPLENVLNTHVPSIPQALSTQFGQFFKSQYALT